MYLNYFTFTILNYVTVKSNEKQFSEEFLFFFIRYTCTDFCTIIFLFFMKWTFSIILSPKSLNHVTLRSYQKLQNFFWLL